MRTSIFLRTVLLLLALTSLSAGDEKEEQKYKAGAERIALPDRSGIDALIGNRPDYKTVVDWVYDKENWAAVLRQIHERLGLLYDDGIPTTIRFTFSDSESPASVAAREGPAQMSINLPTFVQEIKTFPSIGIKGLIAHEFTHAVQFNKGGNAPHDWPLWLTEGMATYTAAVEEPYILTWAQKEPPHSLDEPIRDEVDAPYAWGYLFLTYLQDKFGKQAMRTYVDQIVNHKADYRQAAEKVTKKKWPDLLQAELNWRVKWIKARAGKKKPPAR